jgi:hypothetical protein
MERRRCKLGTVILGITILLSMGFFIQPQAFAFNWGCINGDCIAEPTCIDECDSDPVVFQLRGLEVFIGVNFGSVRCGTTFVGRVYQCDPAGACVDVGYWRTSICYTDYVNIEVCEGTHDVFGFNLEVVFDAGEHAGKRLVLRLKAPVEEAVKWDYKAPVCGPAIQDPTCACPVNDPTDPRIIRCYDPEPLPVAYGPIAAISPLELKKSWGTTVNIECAEIEGWLCHNWAYIPRVSGILRICPN